MSRQTYERQNITQNARTTKSARFRRGRIYPSRGYLALRWSACGVV
ncbi:MAG: hypothetical protein FWG87_10705 [Defluviitaleaceae bacterium]|nr:hypothetical protein [Defluviitaleaceae bacterium]